MKISPSILGRLLEEISWEGNARRYREGGRGFENVLTAEVFQAMDSLPRTAFLGRIIQSAEGGAPETLKLFYDQIEQANLSLLPGDIYLTEHPPAGQTPLSVQPDGIIETSDVYCLVEVKRLKRGTFQPEQLARELLAVLQEAQDRRPLLLLILPEPPPVPVRGHGRMTIQDAVTQWLQPVLERAEGEFPPFEELVDRVHSVIAFTTWTQIEECVKLGFQDFDSSDPSVHGSISRLGRTVLEAIRWHS